MKFVHFTAPNGRAVSVNPEQVTSARIAAPGEYAAGAKTILPLASGFQAVREPLADVEKMLEGS